jgi:hypothetical protein
VDASTAETTNNPGVLTGSALSTLDSVSVAATTTQNHTYGIIAVPVTQVDVLGGFSTGDLLGGNNYYVVGGGPYTFDVQVQTILPDFTTLSEVRLVIPSGNPKGSDDIEILVDPSSGFTASMVSGGGSAAAVLQAGDSFNFTVRISYTVDASTAETTNNPGVLTGSALSTLDSVSVAATTTQNHTYGILTTRVDIQPIPAATLIAGADYYAVGYNYTFNINIETSEPDFTNVTNFTFTIPSTANITFSMNPSALGGAGAYNTTAHAANFSITSGDPNGYASAVISAMAGGDFSIALTYYPSGVASESGTGLKVFAASLIRTIHAGVPVPDFTPPSYNYGVVSTVQFINYALTTTASDGFVNPWDNIFNLTGDIVYNVVGATELNAGVPAGAITLNPFLVYDNDHAAVANIAVAGIVDADSNNAVSLTVQDPVTSGNPWFPTLFDDGIGTYTFRVRTDIGGPLVTDITWTSADLGTLICDKFQVVDVRFQNGGGLDTPPDYYRNIYTAGTRMQVEVQMQYQGAAVNTTQPVDVIASYTYNALLRTTSLTIPAGGNTSNWVEIQNPSSTDVTPPDTLVFNNYQISSITEQAGGRYEGGTGQNAVGRIIQDSSPPRIYWDNADPPGAGAGMFTPWVSTTSAVDTITLNWTPLGPDPEFSTYRIYYKPALSAAWSMIDVNTDPPATNPLGVIGTGTYTITGLQSITEYQYYLTAVDIFGNETLAANRSFGSINPDVVNYFDRVTTGAYGLDVRITDGITAYDNAALVVDNFNPLARPLFDSSIRFEVEIIGASQPDEINVIVANVTAAGFDNDSNDVFDLHPDTDNEVSAVYDLAAAPNGFYRIPISKVSSNKWAGHISSENLLITPGQECKFILEVIQGGTPAYYGYDPNLNMDTTRFTFSIVDPPKVTPWPTRILNNVITSKNPAAYPAYYLTDDAYVTITAYDIKGRAVATLLDNALRKSGQNIREQGWRGTNKAGRKLGIGLYYIHIKAKRVSDGKVIINKFEKVVMAR